MNKVLWNCQLTPFLYVYNTISMCMINKCRKSSYIGRPLTLFYRVNVLSSMSRGAVEKKDFFLGNTNGKGLRKDMGDGVAQMVECWTGDLKTRGSNLVRSTIKKIVKVFRSQICCADSSLCAQPLCVYACIRMITYTRWRACSPCLTVRVRWILETRKDPACTCRTGYGNTPLPVAVALPRLSGPNFPKGITKCTN